MTAVGPKESYPCARISDIISDRGCSVDAHAIIDMLRAERKELDRAIEALERLDQLERLERLEQRYLIPRSGRGRRWMGADERKAVSERMTRYWKAWRARPPHTDEAAS
jgi:hypothetical protein